MYQTVSAVSVKSWAKLRIPDVEMLKDNSFPCFSGSCVTNLPGQQGQTEVSETVATVSLT